MHVTLIAAQSVDGLITRHDEPGSDFTSSEDKVHFSKSLRLFDCRVMGGETYRTLREMTRRTASSQHLQMVITRSPALYAAEAVKGALEFTSLQPAALLRDLESRGRHKCALIGGSQIHRQFFEAGLVDELWLTVEPVLFGHGTPLVGGSLEVRMALMSTESLSPNTLLLKYRVPRA